VRALAIAALVACGNSAAPPPPAAVTPAPADAAQLPPVVPAMADRLAALSSVLARPNALAGARHAVDVIHTLPAWKQYRAHATGYRVLEPAELDAASAALVAVATALDHSATLLRAGHVADAIASFDAAVTAAFETALGTLPSDIVDELVWVRDELCDKRRIHDECAHLQAFHDAYEFAGGIKREIRDTLTMVATALAAGLPSADVHTKTVLVRATGEGPSFGEPCGPEELCKWGNHCEAATHTCEHPCFMGAMDPCPGPHHCVSVPSLTRTYCRR
jgi:hypothetical protein